jgi:hypothetical protein
MMTKKLTGKTVTGIALRDLPTPHDDARQNSVAMPHFMR